MILYCLIDKYVTLHTHIRKSETNIIIINLIVKKITKQASKRTRLYTVHKSLYKRIILVKEKKLNL